MIPPPHGGRLIESVLPEHEAEVRREEVRAFSKLWPEEDQLFDAEKVASGAYSPLEGFMGQAALDSVLANGRLPSSLAWTMPIFLSPPGARNRMIIDGLRPGDEVALLDTNGRFVALLNLEEKFPLDKRRVALATYGTTDFAHPNVADLTRTGDVALGGKIHLVTRRGHPAGAYELTPAESRRLFQHRHWSNVAAYQTRNVPHRAHEHLQRQVLEREEIDGLLVHPVLGRLKPGDYLPEVVLRSYEALITNYYPRDRVVLAGLSITMRYAGPKAALFLAIVRKNFGCSHYIVGRDQAGIGRRYDPYDCHRIFDENPIGVVPLRFRESFYCAQCEGIATFKSCAHSDSDRTFISQSAIRRALMEGAPLPEGVLRPEVAAILQSGIPLFLPGAQRPTIAEPVAAPSDTFDARSSVARSRSSDSGATADDSQALSGRAALSIGWRPKMGESI